PDYLLLCVHSFRFFPDGEFLRPGEVLRSGSGTGPPEYQWSGLRLSIGTVPDPTPETMRPAVLPMAWWTLEQRIPQPGLSRFHAIQWGSGGSVTAAHRSALLLPISFDLVLLVMSE